MPSPHCAARVLHERPAAIPRGEKRASRGPQNANAITATLQTPCRRPVAVLVRSSLGRLRGEDRAPRWATKQPRNARTAQRACSVAGRPIIHGAKSVRADTTRDSNAAMAKIQTRCRRPDAMLVRSSPGRRRGEERAPRWAITQPPRQMRTAGRGCSVDGRPMYRVAKSAWAVRHGIKNGNQNRSNVVPPICRGVGSVKPRPTAWGGARPALGHNTTTPSAHRGARMLRGWSVDISRYKKRAGRAPKD